MIQPIIHTKAIKYLTGIDGVFQDILDLYDQPPSWSRPQGFETLCRIILEQQVSLESGKAAYEKLNLLIPTFSPKYISTLTKEQMRDATISRQKAGYILGLADRMLSGQTDLKALSKLGPEEILQELVAIKGIGPWTAEVYLLFALQSPDIYPRGDIALINTIKELWHIPSAAEAEVKAQQWAPYRSAASYLLWHYYLSKRGRVSPI